MGAPFPPVPNCLQVQIQGSIPGEIWENVLHFSYTGPPPTVSTLTTLANSIGLQWSTEVKPLQGVQATQTNVIVTDLSGTSGSQGIAVMGTIGTRTGPEVFANASVLISYPSPGRFKGGHFRTYLLAGVSSDMANPMNWTSTFTTLVSTAWQGFLGTVIGISAGGNQITQLIGLRRHGKYLPNAGPPNYVLTTPIQLPLSATNIAVHQQVASQKGRVGRRSK